MDESRRVVCEREEGAWWWRLSVDALRNKKPVEVLKDAGGLMHAAFVYVEDFG